MTNKEPADAARDLLQTLFFELFQTEESYVKQCRLEAERHTDPGMAAPVGAMLSAASIVEAGIARLRVLVSARGLETTEKGTLLGAFFSSVRGHVTDRHMNSERSWRLTVFGMRHGIDVLSSLRELASASGDVELVGYCQDLQRDLMPLVETAATAATWFAQHPAEAMEAAKS